MGTDCSGGGEGARVSWAERPVVRDSAVSSEAIPGIKRLIVRVRIGENDSSICLRTIAKPFASIRLYRNV
ncbi:MAG: hypothetical protein ACI9HK_002455 [Pirellulaceae bacterium]|jgi:hypothetical protein